MARSRVSVCIFAIAALLVATPALAQFGSIFTDSPPRPPANVPRGPPADERQAPYYPNERTPPQQPYYPSQNVPRQAPPQQSYQTQPPRPPVNARSDTPPAQPQPPPMSLPPSSRPSVGGIQSQDLAPLPGTAAPPPPQGQPQQPGIARTTPNPTSPAAQPPPGTPQPANTAPQPGDEVVVEPPPQRISNPTAVFSGLDKITGRIISFDVAVNETVQFGALQVTPRVCYSRPTTETPNTDSFVEVDEVTLQGEIKRIFTGWMFAASPGLHAIEHPVYDVWLTDCKGGKNPAVAEVPSEQETAPKHSAKPPAKPSARTPPRRAPVRAQPPGALPALR